MQRSQTRTITAITAVTLAAAMALTGCAPGGQAGGGDGGAAPKGNSTGVTEDSIRLGSHVPLTGPAAAGLAVLPAGWDAYFDYVNDNGGVHGRQIDLTYVDDAYNPTESINAVRRLVQQDKVFAVFGGTGAAPHGAVLDFLTTNDVPDIFPSGGSVAFNDPEAHPNTFAFQADGIVESKIQTTWALENFSDAVYCTYGQEGDINDMGMEGIAQVAPDMELATSQTYAPGATSVSTQVAALQSAGCELVFVYATTAPAAQLVNESAKIGFRPQFVGTMNNNNAAALTSLVTDPADLEGFAATAFLPPVSDTENPWVEAFLEIWEEYGNGDAFQPFAFYGMTQAYLLVAALELAGPDLTREALIETLQTGDFTDNPGVVPFVNSASSHAGYVGGGVSQIVNGDYEPLTTVYETGKAASDKVTEIEALDAPVPADVIPRAKG